LRMASSCTESPPRASGLLRSEQTVYLFVRTPTCKDTFGQPVQAVRSNPRTSSVRRFGVERQKGRIDWAAKGGRAPIPVVPRIIAEH